MDTLNLIVLEGSQINIRERWIDYMFYQMLIHNILNEFYLELHVDWGEMIIFNGETNRKWKSQGMVK